MAEEAVLVVEHDSSNVQAIGKHLEGYGYLVLWAPNIAKAHDILRTRKVSVLVCEQQLDNENGADLVSAIRQKDSTKKIPVLMMSSQVDAQTVSSAKTHGVTDILVKPFSGTRLRKAIAKAISYGTGSL